MVGVFDGIMGDTTGVSREDFDRSAKALLSAFAASKSEEFEPSFALFDWRLNRDGWNLLYLSHPPVTLSSGDVPSRKESSDGVPLEDEGIWEDDQCYTDETSIQGNIAELPQQQTFVTQWTFSIVYSTTYQSPVLYFCVQESNGNPVGRQLLLKILEQEHRRSAFEESNDFPADAWDFVSQEEHPVTGLSSFFLHPCQSSHRLQLLTATAVGEDYTIDDGLEQTTSCVDGFSKTNLLWIWMSMILPAVGHSVPSSYFRHIKKCIVR